MKDKQTKYIEACERNVSLQEGVIKSGKLSVLQQMNMHEAKHHLGVRQEDTNYDERIHKMIKKGR
jgi:hypothetical protein